MIKTDTTAEISKLTGRIRALIDADFRGYLKISFNGAGDIRVLEQPHGRVWTQEEMLRRSDNVEAKRPQRPADVLNAESVMATANQKFETLNSVYFAAVDERDRIKRNLEHQARQTGLFVDQGTPELLQAESAIQQAELNRTDAETAMIQARETCTQLTKAWQARLRDDEYEAGQRRQEEERRANQEKLRIATRPLLARLADRLGLRSA